MLALNARELTDLQWAILDDLIPEPPRRDDKRGRPWRSRRSVPTAFYGCSAQALTNEWTDAINSRDKQKLDALMASDFALYHWNGVLAAPRLQWLDNLFNHIKIRKNTLTDSAPQAYGDFGIVTSVGDWIGSFDGKCMNPLEQNFGFRWFARYTF